MFLRVLGPLAVEVGDPPMRVAVPGAKERAVLGRLLVSPGRAVPVDVLVDDVWSGVPPPSARRSLQSHVVRLRSSLEPERARGSPGQLVVRRGDSYALAVSPESVDTGAAAVAASLGHAARTEGDLITARRRFEAALAFWRGEPFEDWRNEGWAAGERLRLADVQASILEARIDVDLELGRHRELVPELEALIGADSLRESWWVRLMLALYRSDRQADALAAGRRARARLVEELGVDPGPALARIERAVLHHSHDLLAPLTGSVERMPAGTRLHWLVQPDTEPTPVERDVLRESAERADAQLVAAQMQSRRERLARRRSRRLAAVTAAVTVLALVAGLFAAQRERAADASALRADADRLAAAASTVDAPYLSLLLAAQAYKLQRTPQTEAALLSAAVRLRQVVGFYRADGVARQLAASPDGGVLYANTDTQVVAWNAVTHRSRALIDYHSPAPDPRDVAASPARTGDTAGLVAAVTPQVPGAVGSALTLLGPDGRVRWVRHARDLGGWPLTARFTTDGRRLGVLVVAGYGGPTPVRSARYVDTRSGRVAAPVFREHVATGDDTSNWHRGFSADAETVDMFTAGRPRSIVTRDLADRRTTTLALPTTSDTVDLFPVGRGWLVTVPDGSGYWYPRGATRPAQRIVDHSSWVSAVATNAAGSVLVTAAPDQRLVVSDLVAGRWLRRAVLPAQGGTVVALAVNRRGTRAYSSGDDGTVTAWDLTDRDGFGAEIRTPRITGLDPAKLVVIGDPVLASRVGDWVVPVLQWRTPARQGPVFAVFMDPRTRQAVGSVRASLRAPVGWPRQTASLSPDGWRVAITTMFSTAVIDVRGRRVVRQIVLPTVPAAVALDGETVHAVPEPVVASAWSPDGRRLLLATRGARELGRRGAVAVVDTANWSSPSWVLPPGDATALAVSADTRLLAVAYASGDVDVADPGTYRIAHRLHVDGTVHAIGFSPDGTRLAAVGDSRRLDVWDPRTGAPVLTPVPSFTGAGTSVAWLPGTHTAVYGGDDGQVTLFDTDTAVQRGVSLPVFADAGTGDVQIATVAGGHLALFPGYRLEGQTHEGVVYPLDPAEWLSHACSVVRRDLTRAEWNAYLPDQPYHPTCAS